MPISGDVAIALNLHLSTRGGAGHHSEQAGLLLRRGAAMSGRGGGSRGLFVVLGQAFPLYLRLTGGINRYGAAFGLLSLLLAWFAVLAHILLFGCYVNVTYRRRRGSWPRADT